MGPGGVGPPGSAIDGVVHWGIRGLRALIAQKNTLRRGSVPLDAAVLLLNESRVRLGRTVRRVSTHTDAEDAIDGMDLGVLSYDEEVVEEAE